MVYSTTQASEAETSDLFQEIFKDFHIVKFLFLDFEANCVFSTSNASFHPSDMNRQVFQLAFYVCRCPMFVRSNSYNFPFLGHLRILECGSREERPMDKRHRKGRKGPGINSLSSNRCANGGSGMRRVERSHTGTVERFI